MELLEAVYAAFNTSKQIDLELLTPDVEFMQPEIGQSTYFGRDGVARGVQELLDVFEDVQAVPEQFFDASLMNELEKEGFFVEMAKRYPAK